MSLIDEKYWNNLTKLKKCPECGSTNFNIKEVIDVTHFFKNGKKVNTTKELADSQNFQCDNCDLTMDELGFKE